MTKNSEEYKAIYEEAKRRAIYFSPWDPLLRIWAEEIWIKANLVFKMEYMTPEDSNYYYDAIKEWEKVKT